MFRESVQLRIINAKEEKSSVASEVHQQTSFVIRGHRLFTDCFVSQLFEENGKRWVGKEIIRMHRRIIMAYYNGTYTDYAVDVLGENPSNVAVRRANREVFAYMARFLTLGDGTSVELVRTPDGICKACAIGDHCINSEAEGYPDSPDESADLAAINEFVHITKWLGGKEGTDFTIKLKLTSGEPDIESVLTTKKILSAAIKNYAAFQVWKATQTGNEILRSGTE